MKLLSSMFSFLSFKQLVMPSQETKSLDTNFFNIITIASAFFCFVVAGINATENLTPLLNFYLCLFGGVCLFFCYLSVVKKNLITQLKPFYILGTVLLVFFSWLANQGIEGSTTPLFMSAMIGSIYLVNSRFTMLLYVFFIVLIALLLYIQFFQAQYIQGYPSRSALVGDVTLGFIVGMICNGIVILTLKRAIERDQNQRIQQKKILEQVNEDLECQYDLCQSQNEEIRLTIEELQTQKKIIEIQNKQLELTNIELQDLNKTKNKFLSIIGHDLKNPIAAVSGFSELLAADTRKYDKKKIAQFSQLIASSSRQMSDLLDNLLIWARCQTGNIQYNQTEVNINELIMMVVLLMSEFARQKQITIIYEPQQNVIALCDANMINTTIRNLLSNSIKFTPIGGTVEIKVKSLLQTIQISVIDSGVGMSQAQIDSLFQLGEHFSAIGTNNEKGTGLGLLFCNDFLAMHDTRFSIQSTENVGTSFSFSLKKYDNHN